MKLTNRTIPQAKNYQCNKCNDINCHKDMYDDEICYDCWDEEQTQKNANTEVKNVK